MGYREEKHFSKREQPVQITNARSHLMLGCEMSSVAAGELMLKEEVLKEKVILIM